jgi:hypothetical protein
MSMGPFTTYVPPGVYTRTLSEANAANLVAGLRIPVEIGVGQEELEQLDLELVRGSSANLDQQIVNEDVTTRLVVDETNPNNPVLGLPNGTATKFRVRNSPIVDGQGFGRVTNNVRSVSVTINGTPVAVGAVQGQNGYVALQIPPQPGDNIRCTYFFHRSDTSFTDDVSDQVSETQAELVSPGFSPFVVSTGVTDKFIFSVDGTERTITFAAGSYTASGLKSIIDSNLITGLVTQIFTDNQGQSHLKFIAAKSLSIGSGNANGALGFAANTTTDRNKTFRVFQRPIVDGTDGGITTTDPSKVVVKVNSVQVVATAVDGTNGLVTLPYAPAAGSTVTVQYFANTWQDTFDYLPNTLVTSVIRCGFAANRNDYIQGQDFVVSNPSPDVSILHWGSSYVVASALRSSGAALFNEVQVVPTLVDDKLYLASSERVVDTTVVPALVSDRQFRLPEVPTTGNGRDTILGTSLYNSVSNGRTGVDTNRPDLVTVYTGRDLLDALGRPAAVVTQVDGENRLITLKDPVPPDHVAFCSFYYNRLRDDTYILTCKVPGPIGTGQFEVLSTLTGQNVCQMRFGTKTSLPETVQWPRGVEQVPDAFHTGGGVPVAETVTVTFSQSTAKNAVFTNEGAAPYAFYNSFSDQWRTTLNGDAYVTNLNTATKAHLVSSRVAMNGSTTLTIPASPDNVLQLTIDSEEVTVTLTAGARTPAQIVTEINAAIDAEASFSGTAPNALASFVQVGGSSGDVFFIIQSYTTPAALPGGFDHNAQVSVRQGTVEQVLGFDTFQTIAGTPRATAKPATILGTEVGPFIITADVNDELNIRVDGIDYAVTLPAGSSVAASAVVAAIVAVPGLTGVASVGTLANLNKVRLTSATTSPSSSIQILSGTGNEVLGFSEGDVANQTLVSASEVINRLNATASFNTDGVAYVSTIEGQDYVTIESIATGATTSSIVFTTGSASAFNTTTGVGITPGVSGDNGESAHDRFTVSSNNANGSAGTGVPGQTYTDVRTGLRFTILPAQTSGYSSGGSFTLEVSPTWKVNPGIPYLSIPGLETVVTDTVGVGVNDTATLQTFNPSGLEPAIGDFYYVSYRFMKQDFSTRLFQQFKTIEANFGRLTPENRVTLGAYLMILNGAVLVGVKQVLKIPNTNQANDQAFITAINDLATPLPGNVKPDVLVPLSTSTVVYGALMQHCEVQSNIRNQAERMGFIGFASGTSPTTAQAVAKSLLSNRIMAFYPDSAVITLSNELGESFESLVDGTFLAAAVAGASVSPAVDVATPYTRRRIQGFTRLPRVLDPVEANQTAVAGVTILEDLDPLVRIRQGLTTDMSTILSRLPTVTQIADFVQQQSRSTLDSFVGTKFLASRTNEVEVSMTSLFKQLVQAEIVGAFTGIAAAVDPDDPTILRFEAFYQPIFPLLYLVLTFNLRARI